MAFDPITEKIAHFIGSFEMLEEAARMRAAYDEIRAMRAAEQEAEVLKLGTAHGKQAYKLKDFEPELKYKPLATAPTLPPLLADDDQGPRILGPAPSDEGSTGLLSQGDLLPAGGLEYGNVFVTTTPEVTLNFNVPNPNSIVSILNQDARLFDDDQFGDTEGAGFEDISALHHALQKLASLAQDLTLIPFDEIDMDGDWVAQADEILSAAAELPEDGSMGTVVVGPTAKATHVNGEKVEELPEWEDILPAFHAEEHNKEAEDEDASDAHDAKADFDDDQDSPFKVEDGHAVVSGANKAVNSVYIGSAMLDAPVIAVAGDIVTFDVISQVNILHDKDIGFPELPEDYASTAINAASIIELSEAEAAAEAAQAASASDDDAPSPADPAAAEPQKELASPEHAVVVRHEGDVVQINQTKQFNFKTDFDQAQIEFTAAATYLGFGENIATNTFLTQQFGFGFDLIVVGGEMIDVNLLNQRNVILDNDVLSGGPVVAEAEPVGEAPSEPASPAEEVGMVPIETAEAIDGEATDAETAISLPAGAEADLETGSPNLADAALPLETGAEADPDMDGAEARDVGDADENQADDLADAGPPPPAPISGGDNLLFNKAEIKKVGLDQEAELTAHFEEAIETLSQGADAVSDAVREDSAFDGAELLRVLYIDGDFTSVNAIDQTNVIGDADQVQIARDDFAAALQEEIQLTTGSNIAANFATVNDKGLDSQLMAQGTVYSDALIHQANLVDTEAIPNGVSLTELTNEAVAFLADDLIEPASAEDIAANTNSMINEALTQADGLQAILA